MNGTYSEYNKTIPSVKNYTIPLDYIKDVFLFLKKQNKDLTLDLWSITLGFKSRSFLKMVFKNQRSVTQKLCESVAKSINLTAEDTSYLILLAKHSNKSTDKLMKNIFQRSILENFSNISTAINTEDYDAFLASPSIPILQALIAFEDFKATEVEISQVLNQPLEVVKANLNRLKKMELATDYNCKEQGIAIWKATTKSYTVHKAAKNKAIETYHENTADEIKTIIKTEGISKRFRTILFSLPEDSFSDLLDDMEMFLNKVKNKYGNNYIDNKKIIKLNVQAYEVTKTYKKKKIF